MTFEEQDESLEIERDLLTWPNCPRPGCLNRTCRWAGTGLCHPHSVELVGRAEMDRRYADTRIAPYDRRWSGNVAGLEESGGSL